ncbi:TPA: hypothetical protein ACGRT9_000739 [Escherichia coli]
MKRTDKILHYRGLN